MVSNDTRQPGVHEQLLELLSAIMLQINALQAALQGDTPDVETLRSGLAGIEQMTRDALEQVRASGADLPLPELAGVTLAEALTRAVEETAESLGLSSRIVFSGEERPLPAYTERLLYRIAQEALYQVQQRNNTRKLRFTFNYGHDEAQMTIEDDGTLPDSEAEGETPVPHFKQDGYNGGRDQSGPYIVLRHQLEHLGGSLEITTQPEQGTRVHVRLPYDLLPAANSSPPDNLPALAPPNTPNNTSGAATSLAPTLPAASTTPIHLLIVDNLAVLRAGLRRLLESYPDLQVVGEAADGVQAVSEALELGPQVVLMDAHLPNGQSMETLQQIKQLNPDTRVLLLSAQEQEEALYEALRAGADGYVLKDIAPDELAQAIRTVARGEVLVQPQLAGKLLSRFGKSGQGRSHPYEALTAREREVLQLLARGLRNKEIAARLYVSERTVNFHLANIYQKLNVSGRTEALSKALEQGLLKT